jgi:hypothetical protein
MPLLRAAAQWIFFTALLFAAWAYGGTTSWSIDIIDWLLAAALLLWVAELLLNRRRLRVPRFLLFLLLALLGIGAWMVLNAGAIYDTEFAVFVPVRKLLSRAPGSVDYAISAAWMIRCAFLFGTILFVVDLSQDNGALLRLCYAIGFVAGSIALLGLLQKATGAAMIFWEASPDGPVKTFFASFYYHANAGAFLNLVLPVTAGLALRAFTTPSAPNVRAVWPAVFVLTLASVAANTSRMAQFVALLLLLALSWQLGPLLVRRLSAAERKAAVSGAAAILLLLFAVARASHLEEPFTRWQKVSESISLDSRWLASRVAIGVLREAGALGFGPGTFRVFFPVYNNMQSPRVPGYWKFLHEDYLQTALEWGWVGSALWALLFFGGMAIAINSLRKPEARSWSPRRRLILPLVVIALCGVAIHALVDFPLQIASIQLYVATYLGLCWGSRGWKPLEDRERGNAEKLPPARRGLIVRRKPDG